MQNKNISKNVPKTKSRNVNAKSNFYVVGIGASAGGLEAFESFFKNMSADSGLAFFLVPHLDPKHISLMPDIIQKNTGMKVNQIKDGMKVKPNSISNIQPDSQRKT